MKHYSKDESMKGVETRFSDGALDMRLTFLVSERHIYPRSYSSGSLSNLKIMS